MTTSSIASMFDRISPNYDCLNHLLSIDFDKVWRRKTVGEASKHNPKHILDLATGTADMAILLAKKNPQAKVIGVDISERMLAIGKEKIAKQNLDNQIELQMGDAALLPFEDNTFDAVTCGFGMRNFEDLEQCLRETSRVTQKGGRICILEFSMPERFPIKQLYRLYFKHLLPTIGRAVSKDKNAYSYLPNSVEHFPKREEFQKMLFNHDLINLHSKPLSFGIVTLYCITKSLVSRKNWDD